MLIQVILQERKNRAKSNHAAVVKYIASEVQKCSMDSGKVFGDVCQSTLTAGAASAAIARLWILTKEMVTAAAAASCALGDFKNPYSPDSDAVTIAACLCSKSRHGIC